MSLMMSYDWAMFCSRKHALRNRNSNAVKGKKLIWIASMTFQRKLVVLALACWLACKSERVGLERPHYLANAHILLPREHHSRQTNTGSHISKRPHTNAQNLEPF